MRILIRIAVIIGALIAASPAEAGVTEPTAPAGYVQALETADAFLWAWATRDADTGTKLISRRLLSKLKKENNGDWLREYLIGLSNPHHATFEIGKGKVMDATRIVFPVTLYEHYTGEPKAFEYDSEVEVIKEKGVWRVNVLPITSDNED